MRVIVSIALCALVACSRTETSASLPANPSPSPAVAPPAPPPLPPKPVTVTAPTGKAIRVRTASTLSTKTARNGDAFTAVLAEPLVVGGVTIAPRGAAVTGLIADSNPGGRVKGVARIAIRLTRLELAGGRTVDVSTTTFARNAPATKKKDALKIGIGSGIGAAIGALGGGGSGAAIGAGAGAGAGTGAVLLTHGDPAVIPAESLLTFILQRPIAVVQ